MIMKVGQHYNETKKVRTRALGKSSRHENYFVCKLMTSLFLR